MRTTIALAGVVAVLAGLVVGASAAPAVGTRICGQMKNGPFASYWSRVSGVKQKGGRTWTVIATGVDCGFATSATHELFPEWQRAKPGDPLSLKGYACVKMVDSSYSGRSVSSGGGLCHVGKVPASSLVAPNTFAFRMTGSYSIAQIKAFLRIK